DELVASHQLIGPGRTDLVDEVEGHAHRDVAHVLNAAADRHVVHAGSDERGTEVDRLLSGPALTVDRGGGSGDRKARLQPGVATDVEPLLAELLDAAADHVL